MAQPEQPTTRSTAWLAFRVLVLAALWVAANLWFTTHFGRSLTDFGTVNAVLAAGAAMLALLPERDQDRVGREKTQLLQRLVQRLLSPRILAGLVLAFVGIGSLTSSIRVLRAGAADERSVELRARDRVIRTAELGEGEETIRLVTWTLPFFGRRLEVNVAGFAAQPIDLRSWRPEIVALDELAPEPRVFLRIALADLSFLEGGSLRIACLDGDDAGVTAVLPTAGGKGLVGLGAVGDPARDLVDEWIAVALVQLEANGALPAEVRTKIADSARDAWSKVEPGPALPCLVPERNVRAVLCTSRQRPRAAADFTIEAGAKGVDLGEIGDARTLAAALDLCQRAEGAHP